MRRSGDYALNLISELLLIWAASSKPSRTGIAGGRFCPDANSSRGDIHQYVLARARIMSAPTAVAGLMLDLRLFTVRAAIITACNGVALARLVRTFFLVFHDRVSLGIRSDIYYTLTTIGDWRLAKI